MIMLRGIEYQNWYQVIRPIGSNICDKPRIAILTEASEPDLRLRDNVPWEISRMGSSLSSELAKRISSDQSLHTQSDTLNLKKRSESNTYLFPKLKDFKDEDAEIEKIFWNLLKSLNPTCPDDVNVAEIRAALAERRQKLGREIKDAEEGNLFDKYNLGLHAKKKPFEGEGPASGVGDRRALIEGDNLMAMIDRMVAERTKPPPQRRDLFDKNKPIKGKVGFRRDEVGGERQFTDLDEQLSIGDLDKDIDLGKFLVKTGKARFDSKGNLVLNERDKRKISSAGSHTASSEKVSKFRKSGRKSNQRQDGQDGRTERTSSRDRYSRDKNDAGLEEYGRKKTKDPNAKDPRGRDGKSTRITHATADTDSGKADLMSFRKARRYPEWEFPLCNYPKWVHRMYRMDQVKIGQLIKQGLDVPEYVPHWMKPVLDKVRGAKDPKSRGEQPSQQGRRRKKGVRDDEDSYINARKRKTGAQQDGDFGARTKSKATQGRKEGRQSNEVGTLGRGQKGPYGDAEGLADGALLRDDKAGTTGDQRADEGLGGFLAGYEKEVIDLAKLEAADSEDLVRKGHHDSYDMDDLIDEYQKILAAEENDFMNEREKNKQHLREQKFKEKKERQMAALKRIAEKEKKEQQERKIKADAEQAKQDRRDEAKGAKHHRGTASGDLTEKGSRSHSHHSPRSAKKSRKQKRFKTKKQAESAQIEVCAEFKTTPVDPAKDAECMRRFRVLLGGGNSKLTTDDFIEMIRRQTPLFRYEPRLPDKTPCEKAVLPIC